MNDQLEKIAHYAVLFSYYGKLLTKKQQDLFSAYYEEDYSLAEIAESFNISRNAVYDAIKTACKNLDEFENVLKLNEKDNKRNELFEKYENEHTKELIEKLKEME